eukprot:TRINITY_DN5645_c0_g2_i5.p1 TRINITY_DN5645_c0_g2~~TRINITY_DN5645_c0_g2_i5.p1  ORF type:complete len:106 (-),score=8.35 TRINITY_DN5645_c0_g2_i5:47-364(-)
MKEGRGPLVASCSPMHHLLGCMRLALRPQPTEPPYAYVSAVTGTRIPVPTSIILLAAVCKPPLHVVVLGLSLEDPVRNELRTPLTYALVFASKIECLEVDIYRPT